MSTTSRRRVARRRADQTPQRSLVRPVLAAVGVLLVAIVGAIVLAGGTSGSASLPVETNNSKGLASAPVVIENWSDFQCPACKALAEGVERQLADSFIADGQVRLVFRQMAFLGPESEQAAAASECAAEQGAFWSYHDRLFTEQRGRNAGTFSTANLKRFGAESGLDTESFNGCVDDGLATARIRSERQIAEQKGVRKTPTLFVNGQKIEGVPTWEQLRQVVEQSLVMVPAPGRSGL